MHLEKLKLFQFRKLHHQTVDTSEGFTFIKGDNAQGKTSFLEAIHLVSTAHSFIASSISEMCSFGCESFSVHATAQKKNIPTEIGFVWNEQKKNAFLNGSPLTPLSSILGYLKTVTMSHHDEQLVVGSPQKRRRFLDLHLSQKDPIYLDELKKYNHVLKSRNKLLKQKVDSKQLQPWTTSLIKSGSRLISLRYQAVQEIESIAQDILKQISTDCDKLEMRYLCPVENVECEEIERFFKASLEKKKEQELLFGHTLIGPHRDDIDLRINSKSAKNYGSRGQVKSLALSLRFALVRQLQNETGIPPILLMDDPFGEFDLKREHQLLNLFHENQQVFFTSPKEINLIKQLQSKMNVTQITIKDGKIHF